jgi:hypothetical protein
MGEYPYRGITRSEKWHSSTDTTSVPGFTDAEYRCLNAATFSALTVPSTLSDRRFLEYRMSRKHRRMLEFDTDTPSFATSRLSASHVAVTRFSGFSKYAMMCVLQSSRRLRRLAGRVFTQKLLVFQRWMVLGLTCITRAVWRILRLRCRCMKASRRKSTEYILHTSPCSACAALFVQRMDFFPQVRA